MASDTQDKPNPMHPNRGRGSGLPRMVTGEILLNADQDTIVAGIAEQAKLPDKHFKSLAARERSLAQLAKSTNRGSRGNDKVRSRLPHGLTLKQEQWCQNVMAGMTHAQAYREAFQCTNLKPAAVYHRTYTLSVNPRVVKRMEELWRMREGRLSHTPAQLRLFVTERLQIEALDMQNTGSVRARCLQLIGQIGRVGLFNDDGKKPEDNQSVDDILKRIGPLLEVAQKLQAQQRREENPKRIKDSPPDYQQ